MHIARTMPSQDVCLSVCLSHADSILSKWFHLSSNFVHHRDRHTILVFAAQNLMAIFWRWPTNAGGMKKSPFSTNISLYLRNDTRYHHSYYGKLIGTRMQSIVRRSIDHMRLHMIDRTAPYSMTLNDLYLVFKVATLFVAECLRND